MIPPSISTQATRRGLHIPTPVGVDTLHLRISDFHIADDNGLEVTSNYDPSTGETEDRPLYQDGDGMVVEGKSATLKTPLLWARVFSPTFLLVHVTLPKLLEETNVWPVHKITDLALSLNALEEALSSGGIETDIRRAFLTRVDLSQNVVLEERVQEYESVFRSLDFPRTDRKRYEADGYRWKNGSREIVAYDKGLEQTGDKSKTLRIEYRARRSDSVARLFDVQTAGGLLADFNTVKEAFHDALSRLLPPLGDLPGQSPTGSGQGFTEVLTAFKGQRGSYTKALQAFAYSRMTGSERDAFLQAVGEVQGRQAKRRAKQKLHRMREPSSLFEESDVTEAQMYREVRSKALPGTDSAVNPAAGS